MIYLVGLGLVALQVLSVWAFKAFIIMHAVESERAKRKEVTRD